MCTPILSDKELIDQYLAGNEFVLEQLINRHKDKVFTSIVLIVKDKYIAEDIFQDTFIKVIDKLRAGKYKEEGKFGPWVKRIAYNLCIDYFRKATRNPDITTTEGVDLFDLISFSNTPGEETKISESTRVTLRKLIDELPEKQKETLILRHYYNFTFNEIAEMTNVCTSTAIGRMRYSLRNLKKLMEKKEISL